VRTTPRGCANQSLIARSATDSQMGAPSGCDQKAVSSRDHFRPLRRTERSGPHHASWDRKHGEPHDRQQGATNLQSARWSKPSQPGGTARAERVRKVAASDRKWLRVVRRLPSGRQLSTALRSSGTTGSGHQAPESMEGRIFDNPKRGVRKPHGRAEPGRKTRRRAHHG
jgi:hypothetical protein